MGEAMLERVARAMKQRASEPVANLPHVENVLVGSLGDAWKYLARAAIEAMPGWQPIETAPKDGTPILVWDDKARRGDVCGAWAYSYWEPIPGSVVAKWHNSGWASDLVAFERGWESTGSYTVDIDLNPTHWMPLPSPPATEGRNG